MLLHILTLQTAITTLKNFYLLSICKLFFICSSEIGVLCFLVGPDMELSLKLSLLPPIHLFTLSFWLRITTGNCGFLPTRTPQQQKGEFYISLHKCLPLLTEIFAKDCHSR